MRFVIRRWRDFLIPSLGAVVIAAGLSGCRPQVEGGTLVQASGAFGLGEYRADFDPLPLSLGTDRRYEVRRWSKVGTMLELCVATEAETAFWTNRSRIEVRVTDQRSRQPVLVRSAPLNTWFEAAVIDRSGEVPPLAWRPATTWKTDQEPPYSSTGCFKGSWVEDGKVGPSSGNLLVEMTVREVDPDFASAELRLSLRSTIK